MSNIKTQVRIIVEYTWIIIAVVSIATSSHSAFKNGFTHKDTISFFFMSLVSFFMFVFRRNMRKKEEKRNT